MQVYVRMPGRGPFLYQLDGRWAVGNEVGGSRAFHASEERSAARPPQHADWGAGVEVRDESARAHSYSSIRRYSSVNILTIVFSTVLLLCEYAYL